MEPGREHAVAAEAVVVDVFRGGGHTSAVGVVKGAT